MVDLEAEGVAEGEITAGMVAHLLWGSGTTKTEATRAMKYAERVVSQLEEQRAPEPNINDNDLLNKDHPKYSDSRTANNQCANIEDNMEEQEPRTNQWVVRDENESRRIAFSNMEVRASEDGTKLVGYAAVFDSPSEPLPWTEFVKRGAFTKTLNDGADVRLLIDHEGVPLARTTSGTLMLKEDDRGLLVESDLDPTNPDAARLISALRRGDISQMSFAFRTIKDSWNESRSVRELREVQLFDVSVVTFPAYESTVAELRAKNDVANINESNNLNLRKRQIQIARHK
jgi:HK97 family phage prohead protease